MKNLINGMTKHGSSKYVTPIVERFVYGLVYPAVLGACLVEWMVKAQNMVGFSVAIPWLLVLGIFVIDYSVTASETSDAPAKGNMFTAFADFVGAVGFFFAYIVWQKWDGQSAFSEKELGWLVCVVYVHQLDYILWYIFRWLTRDLTGVRENLYKQYEKMLKYNFWMAGIQAVLVLAFGAGVLLRRGGQELFCWMMFWCYLGVVIRVVLDYRWGPVKHRD